MSEDQQVQQEQQPQLESEFKLRMPSMAVFGCGGCGTNLVNKFIKSGNQFDEPVSFTVIDTSHSNYVNMAPGITVATIGNQGSGKLRGTNVDAIQRELVNEELFQNMADINIILTSLAGGSGSVIAPLLAKEFCFNNKAVVLMCVCDSGSHRSCVNSINTLMTFESFAKEQDHYYPVMVYNNQDSGRVAVDKALIGDLTMLVDLMTSHEISELDFQDKMYFLKPNLAGVGNPGVYALGITNTLEFGQPMKGDNKIVVEKNETVHSTLCTNEEGASIQVMAEVDYVGISETKVYSALIGVNINTGLLAGLRRTEDMYAKRSKLNNSDVTGVFKNVEGSDHASGMRL